MIIVLLVIAIGLILWVLFILKSLSEMADENLTLTRRIATVLTGTVGSLAALSDDLAAQTRGSKLALNDVVGRLEKAADRTMFSARQVASDLADREDKVDTDRAAREDLIDTAREGVAEDLAAAKQRADDTVGEPGAAADAAVKTPENEDDPA
jgi:hypothetical protein